MAQKPVQLEREAFCCSICLDLLKDPVTIPCGHSYCMNCIKTHWNEEDQKGIHSCPQCRQTFKQMPVLKKNTMLTVLVEQLKKTELQAAPSDARSEDVACDVCVGRKLKAVKSCLVCLASYCEKHLQAHYESAASKKHRLVDPFRNVCSRHDEAMKLFCRTDQKCICYLCSVNEHKGHETVSAAAEVAERQRALKVRREEIQQRIHDREKDAKLLREQAEAIDRSAGKAVEESEKIFTELIRLIQKRSSDVKRQISSWQETEVSQFTELQEKLELEITELRGEDSDLEQLLNTEDHIQFLHNYPTLSALVEPPHSFSIDVCSLRYFEEVLAAVAELKHKLVLKQPLFDIICFINGTLRLSAPPSLLSLSINKTTYCTLYQAGSRLMNTKAFVCVCGFCKDGYKSLFHSLFKLKSCQIQRLELLCRG
uniref:E3 ubiquitin/ISG15 ligase TRIM25-like n=1 Tax=Kryptolebias marmoratus TaxID=37003 RepID=A0A3Q3B5S6_KRYMA